MKKTPVSIGTSGFSYNHWGDGIFYPSGLPKNRWLEFYARHFKTVELNMSFYRLPSEQAFHGWYRRTPEDFTFAVKGSRFITHVKRLKECDEALRLLTKRASLLREKLALFLWQFPAGFRYEPERLEYFTRLLGRCGNFRHVFEFRNPDWFCAKTFNLLRKGNYSLCFADRPRMKVKIPVNGDFVYVRRHGAGNETYSGSYTDEFLRGEARQIKRWLKEGRDVFVYFNNDAEGYAVKNALTLRRMVEE